MPTITNRQQLLNQLYTAGKKKVELPERIEERSILDHLIYAICRENASTAQADVAFQQLRNRFVDWNEVRVSTVGEIAEVFKEMNNGEDRATNIIGVLQEWFEMTFSFNMDEIHKKGLKEGARKLSRLRHVNDFVVAWVVQQGFGGHAIPLDSEAVRTVKRLQLSDVDGDDLEALRTSLEHYIPKTRGPAMVELFSVVSREWCHENNPDCGHCPFQSDCVMGNQSKSKPNESKPRKSR